MSISVRRVLVVAVGAAALSCNGKSGGTQDTESSTSNPSTSPTTSTFPTTTSATTTVTTSATTITPTTGAASSGSTAGTLCGDGVLQEGEACDDGNSVNGDGCNVDCSHSGSPRWVYQSNMAGDDRFYTVGLDGEGTLLAGGLRGDGGIDKWIAQFNPENGEVIWSERHDKGPSEAIRGIAVSSGIIYATGGVLIGADDYDVWVGGFDSTGKLMWEDTLSSGFGPDYATSVVALPDGDAIVAGVLTPESMQGGVLWVRRYASDGTSKWASTLPDVARPLWSLGPGASAGSDRVVITFSHRISADLQPEMLIAYPLGGGSPLWNVDIPNTNGVSYGVAHTAGGELVIAGRRDFKEFVVRRVSALGDSVAWESTDCIGETGRAIAVDHQGDIVAVGNGSGNIRICKFTPEGALRWGKDIDGGFGEDFAYSVAITNSDYIVVAGWVMAEDNTTDAWLSMFSP